LFRAVERIDTARLAKWLRAGVGFGSAMTGVAIKALTEDSNLDNSPDSVAKFNKFYSIYDSQ
jgi:hypothetical protein